MRVAGATECSQASWVAVVLGAQIEGRHRVSLPKILAHVLVAEFRLKMKVLHASGARLQLVR